MLLIGPGLTPPKLSMVLAYPRRGAATPCGGPPGPWLILAAWSRPENGGSPQRQSQIARDRPL